MHFFDGFIELNTAITAITGGGIGVVLWRGFKLVKIKIDTDKLTRDHKLTDLKSSDTLLKAGVVSMLHHEIYSVCNHHLLKGYITMEDLDDLEYLYSSYHNLGGNGTGKMLYNRVKELEIRGEE
ncbi:hypothetical protein MK904_00465 [Loigolactobacillus coryniformis]|uniref:hypothetical protein n=1 Tax=Loigolactobacillus coryniformis TaxID=1610 RepID=UPI00234149CC|nr:hypothetical protein [Loigolactobacillus coryniformis]MDC4184569.1 hypothetical protein [Loigolactobacillus coryniformis]